MFSAVRGDWGKVKSALVARETCIGKSREIQWCPTLRTLPDYATLPPPAGGAGPPGGAAPRRRAPLGRLGAPLRRRGLRLPPEAPEAGGRPRRYFTYDAPVLQANLAKYSGAIHYATATYLLCTGTLNP